jgi:phosphoribosylpyrophosphate synthetase
LSFCANCSADTLEVSGIGITTSIFSLDHSCWIFAATVRQKLSTIELEFKGKNVLLVDDSIVRGTTSQQIVQMARDAGAKKVFFANFSPILRRDL